jgi:hypothetical protein
MHMKIKLIIATIISAVILAKASYAQPTNKSHFAPLSSAQLEAKYGKIADAIYKVEGGSKTKHPYGVLSVQTSDPRHVCLVTIYHNEVRWQDAGTNGNFLDFLADVYCPKSADSKGNANWHKNIHKLLEKK